jgi:hypothetical protein
VAPAPAVEIPDSFEARVRAGAERRARPLGPRPLAHIPTEPWVDEEHVRLVLTLRACLRTTARLADARRAWDPEGRWNDDVFEGALDACATIHAIGIDGWIYHSGRIAPVYWPCMPAD